MHKKSATKCDDQKRELEWTRKRHSDDRKAENENEQTVETAAAHYHSFNCSDSETVVVDGLWCHVTAASTVYAMLLLAKLVLQSPTKQLWS